MEGLGHTFVQNRPTFPRVIRRVAGRTTCHAASSMNALPLGATSPGTA
mgnify:FL=1